MKTGIDPNFPMMSDGSGMTGQPIGGATQIGWARRRRRGENPPGTTSSGSVYSDAVNGSSPFDALTRARRRPLGKMNVKIGSV